ncbi:MAG: methylhydantoinase [Candidatus Tectimicrobiota bacterium]|nr:MAG: methylhydantoinase [Candidatus Tectomicrobia bacterium]
MYLGIDVGGTFTDFVLYAEGRLRRYKCLTTPADPAQAVLKGLDVLLPAGLASVQRLVHGTTLATNVILERKGEGVVLLTTRGFRDVLEIRRQKRHELYDPFIDTPPPLVPRWCIYEVSERVAADGTVLTPLDEAEAAATLRQLQAAGVQSLAICLLHAYANPVHEARLAALAAAVAPQLLLSLSSQVAPKIREYERTSTTVANAYVMPRVHAYLGTLQQELRRRGLAPPLYVMQSNGGIATAEEMRRFPVRLIESGPAAGALLAAYLGRQLGLPDLIAFDMGGTTAKLCLIEGGQPAVTGEFEVDRVQLKPGSGLPLTVPSIDLCEIGAGGGSIARLRLGVIAVGPESAGAQPGPACYGLGGTAATVTDANLVLGYLNPDNFLGGALRLDAAAATRAVAEQIARPLGLDVTRAAWGIYETVTASMAQAARMVSVERGKDPRRFTLVAFGGAGPLHATRLARALGMRRVLVPVAAGVASALGLLVAGVRFDLERTRLTRLDAAAVAVAEGLFAELEAAGRRLVATAAPQQPCTLQRTLAMRYVGQGHELEVPVPGGPWQAETLAAVRQAFAQAYAATYGYRDAQAEVEIVTWKVTASAPPPALALPRLSPAPVAAPVGWRQAYVPESGGLVRCPVYARERLAAGAVLRGPALVEEQEATTLLLPGDVAEVDPWGNLLITVAA